MSFLYLASPYSKYHLGLEEANKMASKYAGEFIKLKFPVFCPIAHSHSISVHGDVSAKDHSVWMPLDFAFCDTAFALVVTMEPGWKESYGVQEEIKFFQKRGKPIYYWEPPEITNELISELQRDWACDKLLRDSLRYELS